MIPVAAFPTTQAARIAFSFVGCIVQHEEWMDINGVDVVSYITNIPTVVGTCFCLLHEMINVSHEQWFLSGNDIYEQIEDTLPLLSWA